MNKKLKLFILFWFIFSWLILIAFTLKPIGAINTIKLTLAPLLNNLNIPQELVLFDFEAPSDFSLWNWRGTFMEPCRDCVNQGNYSAKITYYAKDALPSLLLENKDIGPKGRKDWSFFNFFKLSVFNPQDAPIPLHIKIKDSANRSIDRIWDLKPGINKITLNLEEVGQFIDLVNIVYLNLYMKNPDNDSILYLDDIRLERGGLRQRRILDKPFVNFIRLSCPKEVRKANSLTISLYLSVFKRLYHDYQVFIHVSHFSELNKRPAQRHWYVNAALSPWIPTSQWVENVTYDIGPVNIYIPKDFPAGKYVIEAGIFNPSSQGSYYKESSFRGAMDFRGSFPKFRFANTGIKDYILSDLKVLD